MRAAIPNYVEPRRRRLTSPGYPGGDARARLVDKNKVRDRVELRQLKLLQTLSDQPFSDTLKGGLGDLLPLLIQPTSAFSVVEQVTTYFLATVITSDIVRNLVQVRRVGGHRGALRGVRKH